VSYRPCSIDNSASSRLRVRASNAVSGRAAVTEFVGKAAVNLPRSVVRTGSHATGTPASRMAVWSSCIVAPLSAGASGHTHWWPSWSTRSGSTPHLPARPGRRALHPSCPAKSEAPLTARDDDRYRVAVAFVTALRPLIVNHMSEAGPTPTGNTAATP